MFQLVDLPRLFPAATVLGNTAGPVVDCGELPAGGRVYIGRVEAGEIAWHFGFETPEAAQRRDTRIADLEQQLATANERLESVRGMVASA